MDILLIPKLTILVKNETYPLLCNDMRVFFSLFRKRTKLCQQNYFFVSPVKFIFPAMFPFPNKPFNCSISRVATNARINNI